MDDFRQGPYGLESLRRRDEEAFVWLLDRHEQMVLALGQSMGLRGADLDEAACEAFEAVYDALPRFEGRSQLKTWVYRICLRHLTRYCRRRQRRRAEQLPLGLAAAGQCQPDAQLRAQERRQRIWTAVAALGPRDAAILELHYRQEWSLEEIAQAEESTVAAVKTRLFRARQRLKEMLGESEAT